MTTRLNLSVLAAVLMLTASSQAAAQATGSPEVAADSVIVVPIGQRYSAGWLRRLMLGREYRRLWATPISVPVLDLASYAGGLTVVSKGGGQETTSLKFRAADGREFYFRSIDKDPTPNLPPELIGTVVAGVVQDQISSAHPTAPLVVPPLLEAAGVLHGSPELFILPDDERLGAFRSLAGLIGMMEPRIAAPWGGSSEAITGDELFKRIEKSPDDRLDVRALLTARLVDILVGDWDRHRDQWSFVRFGDETPRRWVPVPRDRDFALVRYDGLLLAMARFTFPQLIDFGPEYPDILGLTWNGRELDRYFLLELERPVWDSITTAVQAAVTDSVIEVAVRRLPPEHFALNGPTLIAALKRRRDALPLVAGRFYRMLSEQAEVYGTDADERAVLRAVDARTVEVELTRRHSADSGAASLGAAPYYRRRFSRDETKELRIFLRGGADSVVVAGDHDLGIRVRVISGAGADVLSDSMRLGGVRMYDADAGTVVARGVGLDRRGYTPPPKRTPTEIPPRDWGHRWQFGALLSGGPDIGVLVGAGQTLTVYGFRKLHFASQHHFRAGVATGPWTYRADYLGQFRRENSRSYAELMIRASGIDVLRFHGFGNEVPATRTGEYYRVTQKQYGVALSLVEPTGAHVEFSAGPTARFVSTDERANRFLTTIDPYGDGEFGEVGARAGLTIDSRRRPNSATDGVRLSLGGSAYPAWWNVKEAYGEIHAEAATVLNISAPLNPLLLTRVGGKKIWGRYPYFDAAFIGGSSTVRLGRENRFAGDAAAWASTELRLDFGKLFIGAPSDFGILGLADIGRVFLAGESSSKWHGAAGGGIWLSVLDRGNTVSLSVAKSEERTGFYFQAGFGF